MKTLSRWTLALALVFSSIFIPSNADPVRPRSASVDQSIALLPKSDVVVVLDVNRLVNDLLPKAKQAWPNQFAKIEKDMNDFIGKATQSGIDLYKVKSVALGLKLFGEKTTGAMIVDGLTITPEMMTKENSDKRTVEYKGKMLYIETPKPPPPVKPAAKRTSKKPVAASSKTRRPAAQSANKKTSAQNPDGILPGNVTDLASNVGAGLLKDSTAFVQLDSERAAIGDETEVKAIVDALTGETNSSNQVSQELSAALQETKPSGLLRFALNIPDSARQAAAKEQFLQNLAVTRMVLGTLDISDEMTLSLDAKLRTASADEATKLHESLAALLGLGKMMLGGNQDPTMLMLNKLLDQIRLSPQTNDVGLAITIPRELYETFLKSAFTETPKSDK